MMNKELNHLNIEKPRPTLFAASGFVLLAAVGLWISSFLASFLGLGGSAMELVISTGIMYYLPFLLLPIIIYMRRNPGLSDTMRLNPMSIVPMFSVILLGILSAYVSSILVSFWNMLLEAIGLQYVGSDIVPTTSNQLMVSVVMMAALPAVCEELLFRSFVLSSWESRGTWYAIIISSILFTMMHGNLFGAPAYLLIGIVSGYLVYALNSIYAGIIYHTIYNTALLVMSYIVSGQDMAQQEAAVATMSNAAMIVLLLQQLMIFGALVAITLLSMRMQRKRTGIEPIPRIRNPLTGRERAMTILSLIPMLLLTLLTLLAGSMA